MIATTQVDLWQGETENLGTKNGGRPFGFVHGDDGGWFFTWCDTLEDTLATLAEDEMSSDGGLDRDEVADFLRGYLPTTPRGRKMWSDDSEEG